MAAAEEEAAGTTKNGGDGVAVAGCVDADDDRSHHRHLRLRQSRRCHPGT